MIHNHCPDGQRELARGSLNTALILTASMMVGEVVGGILTNSLALLSDAFHMLTHSFALGVSLLGIFLASRQAPGDKSYGYWRVEILAALFNGITLIPIVGYIFYESYKRFLNPEPVKELPMMLIAILGLGVNVATALILRGSSKEDLNVKSAFIHMVGDAASSVGVIVAALLIRMTRWYIIDPLVGVLVALLISAWSLRLIYESVEILLESAPRHVSPSQVVQAIMGVEGVRAVHDLHLWTITSKMYAMTAHIMVDDMPFSQAEMIRKKICHLMEERFGVNHATIQLEGRP